MPGYQSSSLYDIAFKVQSAKGSAASGSGATTLRVAGGSGLSVAKAAILSNELRADGQQTRGRHGSRQVAGTYDFELSIDGFDAIFEAIFRGTYESALTIDQSDITSITTGANTIVATSGSWLTQGIRVGDVIRLTGHSSSGNNSRNLRVTGVTTSTITVAETLTINAVADTSITITRPGQKLINPAAGSLVERYFTIMERGVDIDSEETFTDCKFGGIRMSMQPNGLIACTLSVMGLNGAVAENSFSPTFTSPTAGTGVPLAVTDATIRLGATTPGDLVEIVGFELEFGTGPVVPPVLGNDGIGADVFSGPFGATGSMTLMMQDYDRITDFLNETEFDMHLLMEEQETAPADFIAMLLPGVTLAGATKSGLTRQAGPRTITVPLLLGSKPTTTGYDATTIRMQTSNT